MFFINTSHLPRELTSYDLLKSLAVILMVIDHLGYYIFTDNVLLRVMTPSAPLWFFFVGYATTRNLKPPIWAGAILLVLLNLFFFGSVLPVSILGSIIIARIVIDPLMQVCKDLKSLVFIFILLVVLWVPTKGLFDYGTVGILLTMVGYFLRHGAENPFLKKYTAPFIIAVAIFFILTHVAIFEINSTELLLCTLMTLIVFSFIILFKPITYTASAMRLPFIIKELFKFFGRYSLYIYVGHIFVFTIIGYFLYPDTYNLPFISEQVISEQTGMESASQ